MGLVRWEPFRELEDMTQQLQRLFGQRPWTREAGEEALTVGDWLPSVDIQETEKEYLFKVELPEVKKEDVKVEMEDGTLRISGERQREKEEKGTRYHRVERSYGTFLRTFALPAAADAGRIQAEFKEGLLLVHVAKNESARLKTISVKVT
jgi:HSP20 family protein